jgi:hypothetical protein
VEELLEFVRKKHGKETFLELEHEFISSLICKKCKTKESLLSPLGKMTEKKAKCPKCGTIRITELFHTINGNESFLNCTFEKLGVPAGDVVTARNGFQEYHYEFTEDRKLWSLDEQYYKFR